jgi:meiotic recombination protein SPO11
VTAGRISNSSFFPGYFDCDQDGIAIMQTYCQGSIALAHEQSSMIPEMEWLGMRLNDGFEGVMADEPLVPLTLIDREWIRAMLARQSTGLDNV